MVVIYEHDGLKRRVKASCQESVNLDFRRYLQE